MGAGRLPGPAVPGRNLEEVRIFHGAVRYADTYANALGICNAELNIDRDVSADCFGNTVGINQAIDQSGERLVSIRQGFKLNEFILAVSISAIC